MTKPQFQKELKEKVIPGVKPSDLRKLKRSKSADDIDPNLSKLRTTSFPPTPTSVPLRKSQSQLETSLAQPNPQEQITQLQHQVKFHAETAANYLQSLQSSQAKVSELEEKLKARNTQNEALLTQLAESYEELNQVKESTNLDNSLLARHKSLKDWFTQYQKSKELDQELKENIDEASQELINQDQTISQLRGQVKNLELTNQSLTKDLQLAEKLAELRKTPLPTNSSTNLKVFLIIGAVVITWLLMKNQ